MPAAPSVTSEPSRAAAKAQPEDPGPLRNPDAPLISRSTSATKASAASGDRHILDYIIYMYSPSDLAGKTLHIGAVDFGEPFDEFVGQRAGGAGGSAGRP